MSEEWGFLQEVLAHPDEDWPRLIYADWLEENGAECRANLIRVQIDLANDEPCEHRFPTRQCRCCALQSEERELLAKGHSFNCPLYNEAGCNWIWKRGFVDSVKCRGVTWLTHARNLTTRHPIRSVYLMSTPAVMHNELTPRHVAPEWEWWLPNHAHVRLKLELLPSRELVKRLLNANWPDVTFDGL